MLLLPSEWFQSPVASALAPSLRMTAVCAEDGKRLLRQEDMPSTGARTSSPDLRLVARAGLQRSHWRGFRCAGACSRCSPCGRSIRKSSRTGMACWMSAMEIACTGKPVGTQAVNLWSFSMVAPVRDVPPACVASLILVPTELSSLISAGAVEARPMPANSARISRSTRPPTCFKTSNSFEPISVLKSGSCTAAPWGSTLALAYAESNPSRVTEIVLVGVTMTRRAEIDWLYRGIAPLFPEQWERFRAGFLRANVTATLSPPTTDSCKTPTLLYVRELHKTGTTGRQPLCRWIQEPHRRPRGRTHGFEWLVHAS